MRETEQRMSLHQHDSLSSRRDKVRPSVSTYREYIKRGVGVVMRDKKRKLEELKASHILGGSGEENT